MKVLCPNEPNPKALVEASQHLAIRNGLSFLISVYRIELLSLEHNKKGFFVALKGRLTQNTKTHSLKTMVKALGI